MSYKKSKYFITSKKIKIKYLLIERNSPITVVFFHGFMSDMVGKKPVAIQKICRKLKLNFLKFEYSGHGKSQGNFTKGNISTWINEAKQLIRFKIKKERNLIFIGSSMGGWIALNLLKVFKKRIIGLMGIASAPEFLERLMWKKFNNKIKKEIKEKKIYYLEYGNYVYPITEQLILDGRKNKIFNKSIYMKIPVTLFHGYKDEVVPIVFSKKIIKIFKNAKKKINKN